MADRSLIGWLGQPGFLPMTANVVLGCVRRSAGCDECYAPRWVARQQHLPGRDGIVTKDALGRTVWTGVVKTYLERLPGLQKLIKPRMIFVTALGELFDPQVSEEFLVALWETMRDTPHHIYVILTKLPKRMSVMVGKMVARFGVLPNVWLGVSAEDQHQAEVRIPWLLRTAAAIRLVSCEPLIAPIRLTDLKLGDGTCVNALTGVVTSNDGSPLGGGNRLDWVIVGGESAAKGRARAMHPAWARALRDQATAAGVAFFFKQWGSWSPAPWVVRVCNPETGWQGTAEELAAAKTAAERVGATHYLPVWAHLYGMRPTDPGHKPWSIERRDLPADSPQAPMRYFAGKAAGCELDGRFWKQWPSTDGPIVEIVDDRKVEVTI